MFEIINCFWNASGTIIFSAIWAVVKSFISLLYLRDLYRAREAKLQMKQEELVKRFQIENRVANCIDIDNEVFEN